MLLTPQVARTEAGRAAAARLAGGGGAVASLVDHGVKTLGRELSQAELQHMRRALLGLGAGEALRPRPAAEGLLGLVCGGFAAPGHESPGEAVAVSDHVNLTWRSPLAGPNDDRLGPRFPATAGLYRPAEVARLWGSDIRRAVVACVGDGPGGLTDFEAEVIVRHGFSVASSELAPVALAAAHLGYALAAVVLQDELQGEDV